MGFARYYGSDLGGYGYNSDQFSGLLDYIEPSYSAWSVARRLWKRYRGPVARLRRSSDNAELDFYGQGSLGLVSTDAVRAWNGWNLLQQTGSLDNAYWSKSNVNIASNAGIGPDGQNNMFSITGTGAGTNALFSSVFTVPANTNLVYSLYVRRGTASTPRFRVLNSAGTVTLLNIVLLWNEGQPPTVSSSTGVVGSVQIQEISSGLFRVSAACNSGAETSVQFWIYSSNSNNTNQLIASYPQLEVGSVATTYEPRTTTGAGSSFLVTLYDQTGQGRHFTQATTTLQPIVCESGVPVTEGGRLAAKHVAADARRMAVASSTALYNFLHTTGGSVAAVSRVNDTAAVKAIVRNNPASTQPGFQFGRLADERFVTTTGRLNVASVATNGTSINVSHTGTASTALCVNVSAYDPDNATAASRVSLWQNGNISSILNAETGTPFVENAAGNLTLGAASDGGFPFDGTIQEILIWDTLISDAVRDAYEADAGRFYGITVA